MGLFNVAVSIANQRQPERRISLDALVDTGAYFCAVPASVLHELGVSPLRQRPVRLADGSIRRVDVAEARVGINGDEVTTQVMFNEEGTQPLLGALVLEELMLVVDPSAKQLVPMEAIEHWYRS